MQDVQSALNSQHRHLREDTRRMLTALCLQNSMRYAHAAICAIALASMELTLNNALQGVIRVKQLASLWVDCKLIISAFKVPTLCLICTVIQHFKPPQSQNYDAAR